MLREFPQITHLGYWINFLTFLVSLFGFFLSPSSLLPSSRSSQPRALCCQSWRHPSILSQSVLPEHGIIALFTACTDYLNIRAVFNAFWWLTYQEVSGFLKWNSDYRLFSRLVNPGWCMSGNTGLTEEKMKLLKTLK